MDEQCHVREPARWLVSSRPANDVNDSRAGVVGDCNIVCETSRLSYVDLDVVFLFAIDMKGD